MCREHGRATRASIAAEFSCFVSKRKLTTRFNVYFQIFSDVLIDGAVTRVFKLRITPIHCHLKSTHPGSTIYLRPYRGVASAATVVTICHAAKP